MAPEEPRIEVAGSPVRCPFCHAGVDPNREKWVACASCLARHHEECWHESGKCSACGRAQRLEPVAGAPPVAADFVQSVFGPRIEPDPRPARRATGKLKGDAAFEDAADDAKEKTGWPTLVVSKGAGGNHRTIGEAVRAARPGTRIVVAPGTYHECLVLDRPVAILGGGPAAEVVIEGHHQDVIRLEAELAIVRGVTLRACGASSGAFSALSVPRGQLRAWDCDLSTGSVYPSAWVRGEGATLVLRRSRVRDGKGGGVLVESGARAHLEDCEFANNKTYGIAIKSRANPVVQACSFVGGATGIVVSDGGLGRLKDCDVWGGGVGVRVDKGGAPVVQKCKLHDLDVGVHVTENGEGTFEDCRIESAASAGVLIEHAGNPHLRWCKVAGGRGPGVRVTAGGHGKLEDCTVVENGEAGVTVTLLGHPTLRRCKVRRNAHVGVGVKDSGAAVVEECDLTDNARGAWELSKDARVIRTGNRE